MTPVRLVPVLLLAACSTAIHWEKEGTSDAQLEQDLRICRMKARGAMQPTVVMAQQEQAEQREYAEVRECMAARGYGLKR
jgi:hypothetical protein